MIEVSLIDNLGVAFNKYLPGLCERSTPKKKFMNYFLIMLLQ